MERKSLLKLISILIVFFFIPTAFAIVIEDFEDVSDWTPADDISTITLEGTIVKEGSFSGKSTVSTSADGFGTITKTFGSPLSLLDTLSIWVYIDLDVFTQDPPLSVEIQDSGSAFCDFQVGAGTSAWELTAAELTDETWSNVVSIDMSLVENCDVSDLTTFQFFVITDPPSAGFPHFFYLDNFTGTSDSCAIPASGDWIIIDDNFCTLNTVETITGNLNISEGSLEIQGSGALTVQGGFIYIEQGGTNNNLTILSGGQING